MKKFFRKFRKNLKNIKKLIDPEEYSELLKYIISLIKQNIKIKLDYINFMNTKQNPPVTKCRKGDIFWVDFGYGVGHEFRYAHYCVVLTVERNNVIVVPLTSSSKRITESTMIVDLGIIPKIQKDINNPKNSYALIHSIRSINRTRLMRPRINGKIVYPSINRSLLASITSNLYKHL